MKHSRAFQEAQAKLHEREAAIKKEIESDSVQAFNSGKKIFAVLAVGIFALMFGRLFLRRGGKQAPAMKARAKSRWLRRVLEFLIPFLISAFLESRKQDPKRINNS